MIAKILTHPGGAHKDDFLACAVMLTQAPVPIVRRDPSEDELTDSSVAVIDIGHQHQPELMNFDHHQFPRDHPPLCALSLILQHLGIYEDAREFCQWLETTERLDCHGPGTTAEWLGTDRDVLAKLNSPIDITLLTRFAAATEHKPGDPIWEVMRMIGEDLVGYVRNLRSRLDFVAEHAEVIEVDTPRGPLQALFMPRTEPLPADSGAGLGQHVFALGLEGSIKALISPDGRGEGYGMRKFQDAAELDFTQIESEPDVHFAHARGFIAKSSATDLNRLKELLVLASVD